MAFSSNYAGGLCLGGRPNSRLDSFRHRRQQHRHRRRNDSKRNRHNGFAKYSGRRHGSYDGWNDSGQHGRTIYHHQSEHDVEQQSTRNWYHAEHDGKLGSSFSAQLRSRKSSELRRRKLTQLGRRDYSQLDYGHDGIDRRERRLNRHDGHDWNDGINRQLGRHDRQHRYDQHKWIDDGLNRHAGCSRDDELCSDPRDQRHDHEYAKRNHFQHVGGDHFDQLLHGNDCDDPDDSALSSARN